MYDNDSATPHSAASPPNEESFDDLLSRELLKMSLQDRNAINEEIHGVRCLALSETPRLLEIGLKEFEEALRRMPISSQKAAYEICRKRCLADSEYRTYAIHDDDFRLRFLRCELFDVTKAATRYANYLNFVHELWGPIALQRPIRLADFTTSEMKLFRKGYFQILPFRDQSGRRVIVVLGGMSVPKNDHAMIARVSTAQWLCVRGSQNRILCSLCGEKDRSIERDQRVKQMDDRILICSLVTLLLRSARIVCFSLDADNNSVIVRKQTHSLAIYS